MDLPDTRSLSRETLEHFRLLAVRGVNDLGMTQKQISQILGVTEQALAHWIAAYREEGKAGLKVDSPGRPVGTGKALQPDQEKIVQQAIQDTTPKEHAIPSSAWPRGAVVELIRKSFGIDLTLLGVGKYLKRWNMTPQNRNH